MSVHVPAQGSGLFKIPEAIDIQHAALAEPAACALGAAFLAEARLGDFVAVVGLGGLGQFIAQVLNASGARVIGIDVQPKKLEVAKRYCEFVVDAGQTDPVAVTLAITSGVGADRAVEAVGLSSTLIQAADLLRMGGRLVLAGVFSAPIQGFSLDTLFRKSITVVPAKGPMRLTNPAGAPLVFDYMARGILDPGHLLSTFALEEAQRAFLAQAQGDAVKAGIRPGSGPRGS
ncbi:MAG TPA: zinc-binding dehydrogenase [Limnochordia bacterium]|nr:zinc-binding dehydrogenase [Limnochordia bacterium]